MASSSFRRCPTGPTPSSFRSSGVRLGRTVSLISFSRNAASYFPRPRLRSQTTMSMTAPTIGVARIICRGREGVQGGFGVLGASQSLLRSNGNAPVFNPLLKHPVGVEILKSWRKEDPFPPLVVASSALDEPALLQILVGQATHDGATVLDAFLLVEGPCRSGFGYFAGHEPDVYRLALCSLVVTHCTTASLIACRSDARTRRSPQMAGCPT